MIYVVLFVFGFVLIIIIIIIIIINDIYIAPFKGPKVAVHGGQTKQADNQRANKKIKEAGGPRKG